MEKKQVGMIGENVDRLISISIRGREETADLYRLSRELTQRPTTLVAAEKLVKAIEPADVVVLETGMDIFASINAATEIAGTVTQETDGPIGIAALARALQRGLDAKPVLAIHQGYTDLMAATARGAGLCVIPLEQIKEDIQYGLHSLASVVPIPIDDEKATESARKIFSEYDPKAIIAVECHGPSKSGVYHDFMGGDASARVPKTGRLFDEAEKAGILRIGICDACGYEIGFNSIIDQAKEIYPRYGECKDGCGAGMYCSVPVDVSILAAVANWGAYGVAACLQALVDKSGVLHSPETEVRMIRACVDAGGVDGQLLAPVYSVDSMSETVNKYIVHLLNEIVKWGLAAPPLAELKKQ